MSDIKAQVTRFRVQYITDLQQDNSLQFLKDMASHVPGMKYADHDEKRKRVKVTTNRGDDWRTEVHVLVAEKVAELAWGPDVPQDRVLYYLETFGGLIGKHFDEFLIEGYDCNTSYDVPTTINPYETFEKMFYSPELVASIRPQTEKASGVRVTTLDNDVRLRFGVGESQILAIEIVGNATREEVMKNEFGGDTKIRIAAGLAETDPKRYDTALGARILNHAKTALNVFAESLQAKLVPVVGPNQSPNNEIQPTK